MKSSKKKKLAAKRGFRASRSQGSSSKPNPFEIRAMLNRRTDVIDGTKPVHRQHAPGISRKRAIEKRKETLLPELRMRGKANVFLDRRIGERDKGLSHEDRMVARYAREHARKYRKESIFNLGDSEDLTHRGRVIGDSAELRDDPRSDDEDDDGDDILGEARFGGFLKKRDEAPGSKSWKDRLEEMIATTREKRATMQKQKDDALDLTEKLDSQWKDLSKVLQMSAKKEEKDKEKEKPDDYELLVREFKLSARAPATDGLKKTEKLGELQQEQIQKLEEEKKKRMAAPVKMTAQDKKMRRSMMSADALPEDFMFDRSGELVDEQEEPVKRNRHARQVAEEALSRLTASVPEISKKMLSKLDQFDSFDGNEDAITSLLQSQECPEHCAAVVEALMSKFHVGLGSDNRGQLMSLWTLLLQFLDDCASDPTDENLISVECLMPLMCKLALNFPQYAGQCLQDILIQKHKVVSEYKDYPGLDTFFFIHLIGALFPVTDFRHSVTTPAVVLLSHALSVGRLDRPRAIYSAVYSLGLLLKLTREAERYSPESMTVLLNLLNSALPREAQLKNLFPFETRPLGLRGLVLGEGQNGEDAELAPPPISRAQREVTSFTASDKLSLLSTLLDLLEGFANAYSVLPSLPEIFAPFLLVLEKLQHHAGSEELRKKAKNVAEVIRSWINRCQKPSSLLEAAKPKMLRLYEPRIDPEYMQGRKRLVAKRRRKSEVQILKQRVKEETRGAMKEIRKDSAFVAAELYKEQRKKDLEEKEKLKRLMTSLQGQEAEYKTLQKQKTKLKKKK